MLLQERLQVSDGGSSVVQIKIGEEHVPSLSVTVVGLAVRTCYVDTVCVFQMVLQAGHQFSTTRSLQVSAATRQLAVEIQAPQTSAPGDCE